MQNDKRLIDANALMEYFERLARSLANARYFNAADAVKGAAEKVSSAPTIDAVPVVRCMECKYYNRALRLCNNGLGARPFEFYCADGVKMDGGAD